MSNGLSVTGTSSFTGGPVSAAHSDSQPEESLWRVGTQHNSLDTESVPGSTRAGAGEQSAHNTESGSRLLDAPGTQSNQVRARTGAMEQNVSSQTQGQVNPPGQEPSRSCRKNTKASMKIAALNINRIGNEDPSHAQNKWNHINQLMREQRINILAVGEAHLNETRHSAIETLFNKRLKVIYSKLPHTQNAAGIAIVLNKESTNVEDIKTHEIVPGRALMIDLNWHASERISLLAIYAPNRSMNENKQFWEQLHTFFRGNRRLKPDIILGDFNFVEEAMDRLPMRMRENEESAADTFDLLKADLQLMDGWRQTFPSSLAFTFYRKSDGQQSRLDRIYCKSKRFDSTFEWKIQTTGIPTDHRMVSMKISCESGPNMGPGRWVWPQHIIGDKELTEFIRKKGLKFVEDLDKLEKENMRSNSNNPQTLWSTFKKVIISEARERAKIVIPKLSREIQRTEHDLVKAGENQSISEDERLIQMALLTEKLIKLEMRRHKANRMSARANVALLSETISKFWTNMNKAKNPKAIIPRLKTLDSNEESPSYVKYSKGMANLAKDYHEHLQQNKDPVDEQAREEAIASVLGRINVHILEEDVPDLKAKLDVSEVMEALELSANGSSPGLDGITYEVWKALNEQFAKDEKEGKEAFDILTSLSRVYNDIEVHGMVKGTDFSESWMHPLYKKNDKSDIANYRPISLLNTDYKIMTKALSIKLAKIAPSIIHPNQAGFIPGRQIYDQIWLSKLIIHLAEISETNGALALDQEKAYDKIKHDYLWRTLRAYGIPEEFIGTVQALYSDAYTTVIINGVKCSLPFKVIRGVRQGDPLSCLLFDIAIEPLAEAIRQSDLQGFLLPSKQQPIKTTLFADDTTVFLSEMDDFGGLTKILDEWCMAAGAKFNINKTEIIPIGSHTHRDLLRTHRYINGREGTKIPDHIKIAKEGEPIRSLGALIGNNVGQIEPWSKVLEKIDAALAQWEKGKPTMEGRRLIVLMVIGAMTQFLAKVQGMPKEVEHRLERRARKFLWAEKEKVRINQETIHAPFEQGGRCLLDITSRNEAIAIMWLKSYLNLGPNRPDWAYAADSIIALNPPANQRNINQNVKINPFLQSWNTQVSKLPSDLQILFKIGRKYGIRLEGRMFSQEILREMPVWFHIESSEIRKLNIGKESRCLRVAHQVRLVKDSESLAANLGFRGHRPRRDCKCDRCQNVRTSTGCNNPHKCYLRAQKLMDALPPKWNPQKALTEDRHLVTGPDVPGDAEYFNNNITVEGPLANAFRIFTEGPKSNALPPPDQDVSNEEQQCTSVYTDGSCINNGDADAEAGAGIFFEIDDPRNRSIRIPGELTQTNQTGEIIAIKEAVENFPKDARLMLVSDSRTVLDGLNKYRECWESRGWIGTENGLELQALFARILARKAPTFLKWVKGHSGNPGNEAADKLAEQGRLKPRDSDLIDLTIPEHLRLSGAKLSQMTQSLAYRSIHVLKIETLSYQAALDRRSTGINLERTRESAHTLSQHLPTDKSIWLSIRHKDFSRKVKFFLWVTMHDGYKIGKYWANIPGYEDRGICNTCQTLETMEHILTACEAPGQAQIWSLAGRLWRTKKSEWIKPGFGEILACGLAQLKNQENETLKGDSRLYRIIVSESAYLIWTLRNNRVINDKGQFSPAEIRNRWISSINSRLSLDCLLSNPKYGDKALSKNLVKQTWQEVLGDKDNLPKDWTKGAGVLVSMRAGVG
jgi:ribonuclease HI